MANPKPKIIYDLFFILGKTDVMIIPKNDCGIIVPFEKIKWRIDSKRKETVILLHRKPRNGGPRRATISGLEEGINNLVEKLNTLRD